MKRYMMRAVPGNVLGAAGLLMLALIGVVPAVGSLYAQSNLSVTTVQYNNARTGWNPNETILTVDNVNPATFGKKWERQLDGMLYGAPLYVSGVMIAGQPRNVVYVASENNFIYALDAATGQPVWAPYFLGTPGIQQNLGCGSLGPNIGIASTPVIDLETGTLYAVGLTCQNTPCRLGSTQTFKMAAVDIATGQPRAGWPVTVDPMTTPRIDTRVTSERGALLLANGLVYVPFGGYAGDCGSYHGWVVGLDKNDPTAPQIFYRTPILSTNHRGTAIWASGGIAADDNGSVYATTGNSFSAPRLDYSNAVIRLGGDLSFSEDPADFFMPSNWATLLNPRDWDLGSSAPTLLPPQTGTTTPNMIFVAGKYGVGHLLNRDYLGGVAAGDGVNDEGIYSSLVFSPPLAGGAGSVFSTAAYYEDPVAGPTIFLAGRSTQPDFGVSNSVVALGLTADEAGNSYYVPLWATPNLNQPMSPVVTSAPGQTGILWAVGRNSGVLSAFNASTGDLLYNSNMRTGDQLGATRNFLHFTAIDGKVFVTNSANKLVAYGLR